MAVLCGLIAFSIMALFIAYAYTLLFRLLDSYHRGAPLTLADYPYRSLRRLGTFVALGAIQAVPVLAVLVVWVLGVFLVGISLPLSALAPWIVNLLTLLAIIILVWIVFRFVWAYIPLSISDERLSARALQSGSWDLSRLKVIKIILVSLPFFLVFGMAHTLFEMLGDGYVVHLARFFLIDGLVSTILFSVYRELQAHPFFIGTAMPAKA